MARKNLNKRDFSKTNKYPFLEKDDIVLETNHPNKIRVERNEKYALYTTDGEEILPFEYKHIDSTINANGMVRVTHLDGSSGAAEAFIDKDEPDYVAHIKNITKDKWLANERAGKVVLTSEKKGAMVFYDEADANSTLEMLNDTHKDSYTLIEENKKGGFATRSAAKGGKAQAKVEKVMGEFKRGTLHSGRSGKKVKSREQAVAIALSEARKVNPQYQKKDTDGRTSVSERIAKRKEEQMLASRSHSEGWKHAGKTPPVNKFTDYYLIVNMDERGDYSASVYDPNDKSIYEIQSAEQVAEMQQDGFLKYKPDEDLDRLTKYLINMNTIPNGSQIYSEQEFEKRIKPQYEAEEQMKRGARASEEKNWEERYGEHLPKVKELFNKHYEGRPRFNTLEEARNAGTKWGNWIIFVDSPDGKDFYTMTTFEQKWVRPKNVFGMWNELTLIEKTKRIPVSQRIENKKQHMAGGGIIEISLPKMKEKLHQQYFTTVPWRLWNYDDSTVAVQKWLKEQKKERGMKLFSATYSNEWSQHHPNSISIITTDAQYRINDMTEQQYDEFYKEFSPEEDEEMKHGGAKNSSSNEKRKYKLYFDKLPSIIIEANSEEDADEIYRTMTVEEAKERGIDAMLYEGVDPKFIDDVTRWRSGIKRFNTQYNIGKAKYVVNYHKGGAEDKHKDGSDFFDIYMTNNKKEFEQFKKKLLSEGYVEDWKDGGSMAAGGRVREVEGTYGSGKTPSTIFVSDNYDGSHWYVAEGGTMVNKTYDDIEEGVHIEELSDVDVFTMPKPIKSLNDLEAALEDEDYKKGGEAGHNLGREYKKTLKNINKIITVQEALDSLKEKEIYVSESKKYADGFKYFIRNDKEAEKHLGEDEDYYQLYGKHVTKKGLIEFANNPVFSDINLMHGGEMPASRSQSEGLTHGGGAKKQLKKGDTVQIIGRRWFDRINGNTYHSAEVYVNNEFVGRQERTYGYGESYIQSGWKILLEHYSIPKQFEKSIGYPSTYELNEYGIKVLTTVSDVSRKKDLECGGMMRNGATVFETGATTPEVDDLILYADNTQNLAKERDSIYKMAVDGSWSQERLHKQFKRIFSYMAEVSYNKEVKPEQPLQMNKAQRNEFAKIYADDFPNWKREHDKGEGGSYKRGGKAQKYEWDVTIHYKNKEGSPATFLDIVDAHNRPEAIEEAKAKAVKLENFGKLERIDVKKIEPFKKSGKEYEWSVSIHYKNKEGNPATYLDVVDAHNKSEAIEKAKEKAEELENFGKLEYINAQRMEAGGQSLKVGGQTLKDLEFENIHQYFDYIDESKINGNHQQVRDLFKKLDEQQKKDFFSYARQMGYTETVNWINEKMNEGGEAKENATVPVSQPAGGINEESQKIQAKIDKIEKAIKDYKGSAKGKKALEDKLANLNRQLKKSQRVPLAQRLKKHKGNFYLEIPTEHKDSMYDVLNRKKVKARYNTLGDKTKIVVKNYPTLNQVYAEYSKLLEKKSQPVPFLDDISGTLPKVHPKR